MRTETQTVSIHGYPVVQEWRSDGTVVYRCPFRTCPYQTSYSCRAADAECRLNAYVGMHDHIKGHLVEGGAS
jgi:hypothetical protein